MGFTQWQRVFSFYNAFRMNYNVHVMPQALCASLARLSRSTHVGYTRGPVWGPDLVQLFDMEPPRVELGHVRVLRDLAGAEQYLGSRGSGLGSGSGWVRVRVRFGFRIGIGFG